MTLVGVWSEWVGLRGRLFRWRTDLAFGRKLALSMGIACFTGLLAQIRIPLATTPVPITGQVFGVLLAGALLGKHFGALSLVFYVGLGALGVPWFAGWTSAALFGPTGGYLIGFIPAAALVGWLIDSRPRLRRLWGLLGVMVLAVFLIYLFGAVHFAWMMRTDVTTTLLMAVWPFIPFDLAKALVAAVVATILLPKPKDVSVISDSRKGHHALEEVS